MKKIKIVSLRLIILSILACNVSHADVPGRPSPLGPVGTGTAVPNPGVQQQELPNITFPAPYNVFEFPGTCMACHGGTIDQSAGHGGNWAGSNMASATRDPVFRANQLIVNHAVKERTGQDGAGNRCFRCHSPNGWLSGRFDPTMGGSVDGSDVIHSIVLSTDDEGVQCEQCHRAIGNVTMQRPDLDPADPAWNMLSGLYEWPHAGSPYPAGPSAGNPLGEGTLQYHDGMSYGAKYGGNVESFFSDLPLDFPGGTPWYTGQTYGIYPFWFTGYIQPPPPGMPATNLLGEPLAWNPDGSLGFVFEAGVTPDALWGAISPEHSTRENLFVKSSEFCGSCHDLTDPVLNHGMPEQRTYTEWKYSRYSQDGVRCQDCHMPTMKHEFSDDAAVGLNPDPLVSGWYPYARDRNPYGGTAFHKLAGANRDLPAMMKVLYPEVDLELIGAPTGHDPMVFPGLLSDRGPMYDRHIRNTEISLLNALSIEVTGPPAETAAGSGVYQVKVKVTNHVGHKVPSGFPDGRRMWIGLVVKNAAGKVVYKSGHYDPATARLYNDSAKNGLKRALTPQINSTDNAVMIYERKAGAANGDGTFAISFGLLNEEILFDNRIPPLGFDAAAYSAHGAGFVTYSGPESAAVPSPDPNRYPAGQNWDEVTYTFTARPGQTFSARATVHQQTLPREFMDYLKDSLNAIEDQTASPTPRPQGPPNILDPNYPLTPTYLSDSFRQTTGLDFFITTDLNGTPLRDNWAGVAYASWLQAGKGAPFRMAADDTALTAPPAAPATVSVIQPFDRTLGMVDANTQVISWGPVAEAEGYLVWVRYGKDTSTEADPAYPLTASWDRLAVVKAPKVRLRNEALNPGKTFQYKVQAFNAKGMSADSLVVAAQTLPGQPLPPTGLKVSGVTANSVTISWYDEADNETNFVIQRQVVPINTANAFPNFVTIATIPSATAGGGFGANSFTDTGLLPGRTYNYQVAAMNAFGLSAWTVPPVAGTTAGNPMRPTGLTATVVNAYQVDLAWHDNSANELSFRIQRATNPRFTVNLTHFAVGPNITSFRDATAVPNNTYYYRVFSHNTLGDSAPSMRVTATTPPVPPAAPSLLLATPSPLGPNPPTVTLTWTDNATDETGLRIERALDAAFTLEPTPIPINTPDTTAFTDTTVGPKTTYFYRLFALNANGDSLPSNAATCITAGEIPEAPANLTVQATGANFIVISWVDNSTNEQTFQIERSPNGVDGWTLAGTVGANVVNFYDSGLTPKTTYWYRVLARNPDGLSAATDPPASATTL